MWNHKDKICPSKEAPPHNGNGKTFLLRSLFAQWRDLPYECTSTRSRTVVPNNSQDVYTLVENGTRAENAARSGSLRRRVRH